MQLDLLEKELASARAASSKNEKPDAAPVSADTPEKSPTAFKTISEAATILGVPQHVLRFWEGRFSQIKPLKLRGGRRYYRPEDMEVLTTVKNLLYKQGYTIKGAKKAFSTRSIPAEAAPIVAAPPPTPPKVGLTDKQHSQLSVIKQELMGLRDALKPYVF